jgi:hypothetical protein
MRIGTNPGFTATDQSQLGHRGFHMEFSNGWSLSVQWGWMNYCSNHSHVSRHEDRMEPPFNSRTAEVLIMWKGEAVPVKDFPSSLYHTWQYVFDEFGVGANLSSDSVARLMRDVVVLDAVHEIPHNVRYENSSSADLNEVLEDALQQLTGGVQETEDDAD